MSCTRNLTAWLHPNVSCLTHIRIIVIVGVSIHWASNRSTKNLVKHQFNSGKMTFQSKMLLYGNVLWKPNFRSQLDPRLDRLGNPNAWHNGATSDFSPSPPQTPSRPAPDVPRSNAARSGTAPVKRGRLERAPGAQSHRVVRCGTVYTEKP